MIVIELPYDVAEAVNRLRPLVIPPSRQRNLTSGDKAPLVGEVGLHGIHVKANTSYRSSFAAEGHGVFTRAEGGRCRLELQVGISFLPLLFMVFWFAMLFVLGYQRLPGGYGWWQILTVAPDAGYFALMLAGGVAVCGVGLFLSRSEASQIEDAIRAGLGAPRQDSVAA